MSTSDTDDYPESREVRSDANPHDVYSYGVVSSSTLYAIKGVFPDPEGYAEIDDVEFMTGGEATNSSIVLSRLGARVKLDGNWLGDDESGKRTKAILDSFQIDTSRLPLRKAYKGAQEVVFAAQETRTIFGTYGQLLENEHWNLPDPSDISRAKAVCLDPFFNEASLRAAEIGFSAGVPVITVDCLHEDPLLRYASATVISEAYIQWKYPNCRSEDVFDKYRDSTDGLLVFTSGGRSIRFARSGEAVKIFEPYSVDASDTSGAGDAFRAGIVYGFLQGWDDDQTVEFAAAVAGIICTRYPGVLKAPSYDEVRDFMASM